MCPWRGSDNVRAVSGSLGSLQLEGKIKHKMLFYLHYKVSQVISLVRAVRQIKPYNKFSPAFLRNPRIPSSGDTQSLEEKPFVTFETYLWRTFERQLRQKNFKVVVWL